MNEQIFFSVESGAHAGDFGQNQRKLPSLAQLQAGNYKKGRFRLHGLAIAIENPRGSYRSGRDPATGRQWTTRLAAHYGYLVGTSGNDGDPLDCFVGEWLPAERVYVVNQYLGGVFDEHKAMLAFPDREAAMLAYQNSFEHGWDGLHSIVPCSVGQFKWWLKYGNRQQPLLLDHLPYEGKGMTRNIVWDANANPGNITLSRLLYNLRKESNPENGDLLMDAPDMADFLQSAEQLPVLDALVRPYKALQRTAAAIEKQLNRVGQSLQVAFPAEISEPFMSRGVAQVVVLFHLSDGQTISIYFHNPDTTPKKISPTDELISWKWLLNKKDITIVVAPEEGRDLDVTEVARRIMKLAEQNSAAFQRANQRKAERNARLAALNAEIAQFEQDLRAAQSQLETLRTAILPVKDVNTPENGNVAQPVETQATTNKHENSNSIALTGKELGDFPDTPEGKKALRQAARQYLEGMIGEWVACPALGGDVEIRKLGAKKVISLSADARKLKIVPVMRQLITASTLVSTRQTYDQDEINIKAYHVLRAETMLEGVALAVRFVIREDDKGVYHYDHAVKAIDAVFDSVINEQEKSPDESELFPATTTNDGGAYRTRIARCQLDVSIGQGDGGFNRYSAVLDAVNGGMVFNLFIEGEALEVLEVEPEQQSIDEHAARIEALRAMIEAMRTAPQVDDSAIDALLAGLEALGKPPQSQDPKLFQETDIRARARQEILEGATSPDKQFDAKALQNRDRSRQAYVMQMKSIADNPDYDRLSTSKTPSTGAPMVFVRGTAIPEQQAGKSETITMADGKGGYRKIPAIYAVVEADALLASHDAQGNTVSAYGGATGIMALNNGRTAGLKQAYKQGTADNYRKKLSSDENGYKKSLMDDEAGHGVKASVIEAMQQPVLVRVFAESSIADIADPGAASNERVGAELSASEQAETDAGRLNEAVLMLYQGGAIDSVANRDFVRAFMAAMGGDTANMQTKDGQIAAAGIRRIEGALVAKAYGDGATLTDLTESPDSELKSLGDVLKDIAGRWAVMVAAAQEGRIAKAMDITANLNEAVALVRKARQQNKRISELVNQTDMFSGQTHPVTEALIRLMFRGDEMQRIRSADKIKKALHGFLDQAMATVEGADMFGYAAEPMALIKQQQDGLQTEENAPKAQKSLFDSVVDYFDGCCAVFDAVDNQG